MSDHSNTDAGMTQQEIAKILGVSKSMVHLIERRAMQKLRNRPASLAILAGLAAELQKNRRDPNGPMEVLR